MHNRETVLNKINNQEKEWDKQIKYLQLKVASLDMDNRAKIEKYVNYLDSKLKHIQSQTEGLKIANEGVWEVYGTKIAETWEELVHNVDYVILSYKNIIG